MSLRLAVLIASLSSFAAAAHPASAQSGLRAPPFVGCATDGQQGPQPPPSHPDRTPSLPPRLAARLAYYSTGDMGVLAPRGWRCIGLVGSNGGFLVVTPEAHSAEDFISGAAKVRGKAVQLAIVDGGTSGRFQVARIAPAYFRQGAAFARQVAREARAVGGVSSKPMRPYPRDRLLRRTKTEVVGETPPGRKGLGTESHLVPNGDPILAAALLIPQPDMDLVLVQIRLGGSKGLPDAILGDVERSMAERQR
jgi:hypothetical protein